MITRSERNFESYLALNLEPYAGQWVAIIENKVIASAKSFKDVYAKANILFPGKKALFDRVSQPVHHFLK